MFITVSASLISGIIAISYAVKGFGVWALASNYVSLSFITSILFYMVNPWLPKYFVSKESFNRLFGFGSKLLASGILNTLFGNIYKLVIGKFFSAASLGFYTHATMYVSQVTESASSTLETATYPILSKTKHDPARLKTNYQKIIKASSYVIFPLTMGLPILAKPLILFLVGEKWIESVPFVQILCFSGVLYHLHAINLNVLK